ncbi:tetratricopeptide repeat protein [Methanoculleus frigidifontis]|nr:tetratricopeptide repeat protein [Methanoculleus sp. FWC-SCC1]
MIGNSQESRMWYNRGRFFSDTGEYDRAALCYGRVLEYDPRDARAWRRRGFALIKLERFDEAVVCYERALELDPGDAVAWQRKGFALGKLRRLAEAKSCLDRALALNPSSIGALHGKGWVLVAERRYDEAMRCYDRILAIDPDRDFARWNRQRILEHKAFRKLAADVGEAEKVVKIPAFVYEVLENRDYGGIDRASAALSELLAERSVDTAPG